MNGFYELHFHGNRQEIEKEKQRKRELMLHFPQMLGTVDETKYVLQDDEKPKQEICFDNNVFSPLAAVPARNGPMPNIRGIGELHGEKRKKDESLHAVTQGVANLGNRENPFGYGNRKDAATFLSLQKEKNETRVPKSPFDFGGNSIREENSPFSTAIQFPGLRSVGSNRPRTTTARNDSLGLRTDKMENIADSLKRGNVNNTNTVPDNAAMAKPDIPPGLYGGKPDRDYAEDLRKVKQNLPPAALNILNDSGIDIIVCDNLHSVTKGGKIIKRNGRYFADKKKIYLDSKNVDEYTLISEIFHAAQNKLGMTGVGKSNLEFQEHVIKDLYFGQRYKKTENPDYFKGFSTTDSNDYEYFIRNVFDENGNLNLKYFLIGINSFFDEFQEYYSGSGAYQEPGIDNYDYKWKKILDLFGIEYK